MSNDLEIAIRYLTPGRDSFWRWSADGDVIEWHDGSTIVFAEELVDVLDRICPTGLPRLDALVALLAMCRDDWPIKQRESSDSAVTPIELDLPADMRRGPAAKAVLADLALGNQIVLGRETARAIVETMRRGIAPEALSLRSKRRLGLSLSTCLTLLHERLEHLGRERVALRMRTGLDAVVSSADLTLPTSERARRLIASVRNDRDLGGIAAVAKNLMAAVQMPRRLADPEDQPIGGISDLSNRGQLDRLLISELAHDDETLALRLALGEALFLRRETPPRKPTGSRCILIDSGIRTWGLPRVFGTAVGLALAATTDKGIEVRTFGARSGHLVETDLLTREGLIRHLEALETEPHPGSVMEQLLDKCRESDSEVDAVVVTHRDALQDPSFRDACKIGEAVNLCVATVDRRGAYRLWSVGANGKKCLAQAELDLEPLTAHAEDLVPGSTDELPVILSIEPFPLRVAPGPLHPSNHYYSDAHGLVSVTGDGRLLRSTEPGRGGLQVTAVLPALPPRFVAALDGDRALAILWRAGAQESIVAVVELSTGNVTLSPLHNERFWAARVAHGLLIVVRQGVVDLIEPATGRIVDQLVIEDPQGALSADAMFVRDGHNWYVVSHNGAVLRREPIHGGPTPSAPPDVPSELTRGGNLYRRLQGLALAPGELQLWTQRQKLLTFTLRDGQLRLLDGERKHAVQGFIECPGPEGCGYGLSVATSPNGSHVYFDSRGLIHLVSVNGVLPQLTVVLASSGEVAGWSSDSRIFGNPYFCVGEPNASSLELRDALREFAERMR